MTAKEAIFEFTMRKYGSLYRYALDFFCAYWLYCLALLTIALGSACFEILVEYKIKEIIDQIAYHQGDHILVFIAFFVVYKLMSHLVYFFMRIVNLCYAPSIIKKTVLDVYAHTFRHSLYWFDSRMSGDIASKISDFQEGIATLIDALFRVATVIFTVCIGVVFLFAVHSVAAWVLLGFILVYLPLIYYLLTWQMEYQQSYYAARQDALGIINDGIVNVFAIKIIGHMHREIHNALLPVVHLWQDRDRKRRRFDTYAVDSVDTVLVVLMSAIQIYLLAYSFLQGAITAGGFAFVSLLTLKIHRQLNTLLDTLLFSITPNLAKIRSSYEVLFASEDVLDMAGAEVLSRVSGRIDFESVAFRYDQRQRYVLKDFSLSIRSGEQVGLVGLSGAGKTTIIKCLLRYFDITSGDIKLDHHSIRSVTQDSLRDQVSMIPQDITMLHRSILDNLLLACPDATLEKVQNACRQANIHQDIMDMPDRYATIVGERGVKLSGGQRQRIAIARAILKDAPILILDEATSSLDSPTEKLIQASIDTVLEKSPATVIAIAHRLSTLIHMDRIVVLDKGRIVEEGAHHALIKKNGHYKHLWDMQLI